MLARPTVPKRRRLIPRHALRPICSPGPLPPKDPARTWSATSPTSRPKRVGSIWRLSSLSSAARSSAGASPKVCTRASSPTPCNAPSTVAKWHPARSSTLIAAANTPPPRPEVVWLATACASSMSARGSCHDNAFAETLLCFAQKRTARRGPSLRLQASRKDRSLRLPGLLLQP